MKTAVETPSQIEPCFLESIDAEVTDLIASLSAAAERVGGRLHPDTAASLADLVRVMNCYYSNLIEGHNTTPREIELALAKDFAGTTARKNLQMEALAHIRVQREIDRQYSAQLLPEPASRDFICWLHRAFYEGAEESVLQITGAGRAFTMEPGVFRSKDEHEVSVGRHIPPGSHAVQSFMAYFEERYKFSCLGKGSRVIAMAAAHHRFNYVHPFLDGNGRVSRLMSHAMALQAGIGAHGLWSVSCGLARGLVSRGEYKQMMDAADTPRMGDLDGRGNLSLKILNNFVIWFLKVCLDQVIFMESLFDLESLARRLKTYTEQGHFKPEAFLILERILYKGELPRGEAAQIGGMKERTARTLLSALVQDGILGSNTPKGSVSLRFPLHAVDVLFPKLFPAYAVD